MSLTTLASHDDYRITLHQKEGAPQQRVAITFGGQPSDIADSGFGTDFLLSLGWDTIYVAQRFGTQFQGLSIEAFQDAVSPVLGERKSVLCYGSSLGAYAALYFGGVINARIIAAAPMLPAWRPLGNKVYADLPMHHLELNETPRTTHEPVIIYDPMLERDSFLVEEMVRPAYPRLRAVEVPFGGHTVLVTLSRARLLKPLVVGLLERDEIATFDPPGEGTATWHGERGLSLRRSDPEAALVDLEESIRLMPIKRYYNELVKLLIRRGDLVAAQARIDAGRDSGDRNLVLVPSMSSVAEAAGLRV